MEMEVVVPVPPPDFNFDSACSSPYMTAPSSPQRFGNFFFSAPASPTRVSALYAELSGAGAGRDDPRYSASAIPFKWEEKPGVPKGTTRTGKNDNDDENEDEDEDFEFDFSGQLERTSLSAADELFAGGKIRPLKPPPGNYDSGTPVTSPRSPRSRISQGKKMVQEVLMSPRRNNKRDFDPFTAAIEETRKKDREEPGQDKLAPPRGRGLRANHDHNTNNNSSNFVRKGTRSLSPMRVSDVVMFDPDENSSRFSGKMVSDPTTTTTTTSLNSPKSAYSSILSAISFAKDYRKKWKLKDLLLFRSASEGRASTSNDPLRKYTLLSKKAAAAVSGNDPKNSSFRSTVVDDTKNSSFRSSSGEDAKNWSFRSTAGEESKNLSFQSSESVGSVSSRRRGTAVSAHELHYTVNRAVSEEMKKKTFLPYKQGLLGCLGFNPGVHEISRSFGSLSRG